MGGVGCAQASFVGCLDIDGFQWFRLVLCAVYQGRPSIVLQQVTCAWNPGATQDHVPLTTSHNFEVASGRFCDPRKASKWFGLYFPGPTYSGEIARRKADQFSFFGFPSIYSFKCLTFGRVLV